LIQKGVEYETVRYLEQLLSFAELKELIRSAGLKPHDVVRKNEPAYREHVAGKDLTDAQLIELMVQHPDLIQRPFVVRGKKAVLARPVENISKLDLE
jgi:arsenate reductase